MMGERTLKRRAQSVTLSTLTLPLIFFCVCACARAQAVGGNQSSAPRMSVLFTAMDKGGKFVTTLRPEDVRLTVDGVPREILEMKRQSELPLFVAIVIDTSVS